MKHMQKIGWMAAAVLMAVAWTVTASAEPFEKALDEAADNLTGAMARAHWGADTAVGVAPFIGSAGVACEPMSSILTGGLREAMIRRNDHIGLKVKVVEDLDPRSVRAVVSGRWYRDSAGTVRLAVKLGDVTNMQFADVVADQVRFDTASLPPDARSCVLELEPIDRDMKAPRRLAVRASPSSVGNLIQNIEQGNDFLLVARVLSQGAENWFVVRLPDDQTMPVGMRERRGFVYDVPLPKDVANRFKVDEIDSTLVVTDTAKMRAEPSPRSDDLGTLPVGAVIAATGRVVDRDWYRIAWRNDDAYIYAPLTKTVDAAEAAAWNKIRNTKDRGALEGFLDKYGKSPLVPMAREALAALGPPPLTVKVWTEQAAYREGQAIKIFLKGNKDFYARIVYRDVEGNLIQLLPNQYRRTASFSGGQTYAVPDQSDAFDLVVGPPFGTEQILVFASTTPVGSIAGQDIGRGLSLLSGSIEDIRKQTRGVAVQGKAPGDVKTEFVDAEAKLKTGP